MAWTSTVPAVLAALTTTLDAAITDASVSNGAIVGGGSAKDSIIVGYQSETDPTAVVGRFDAEDYLGSQRRERYTVGCQIAVVKGGTDITRVQTRLFGLLAKAGAALAANPTLSGLVMTAGLGSYALTQDQTRRGASATLLFDIEIDANTTI